MSERTRNTEPFSEDERQEQLLMDRCTFALMVNAAATSTMREYLKDKTESELAYYADVWDAYSSTPVGVMFRRPDFEGFCHEK